MHEMPGATHDDTAHHGNLTTSVGPSAGSAGGTKAAPACTLAIFGAGGDLTKRLLMPALYNLSVSHLLADDLKIIGIDRGEDNWKDSLTETMQSFTKDKTSEFYTPKIDDKAWGWVTDRLQYHQGDFGKDETFAQIGEVVGNGNVVFYLAVASRFFGSIVEHLGSAGLLAQSDGRFRRVIIEKPFGSDLPSAQALNTQILAQADESQFYRIDHFLGKETVQSIMAVRFANGMFEPTWRREHIDCVEITAAETVGVEKRGAFYEPTGALRDMVPNHLFTLLSMVAMEPPNSFDAEDVRSEKAKVIEAIRPLRPEEAVRGQYGAGQEFGEEVLAYREEPNVASDSRTETYIALVVTVENWRWAGVPFYLRTGKRMSGRRTEINIHHKPAPFRMFRDTPVDSLSPNVVRLLIDPEQGIETVFDAKVPGPEMKLGRVGTSLRYADFFAEKPAVGYEALIYDCMIGDPTLFQRADAIEASWRVVQPLLESWSKREGEVAAYASGSEGPAEADALLAKAGHCWTKVGREKS